MKKGINKSILFFFILSFTPMWGLSFLYYTEREDSILLLMMLLPAVSSVITRAITKEGFSRMMLRPRLKGNLKWYLISYFASPLVAYLGAMVYFLAFPGDFSPLRSVFAVEGSITSTSELIRALLPLIPLAILINPIMGIVQCFGEELGWRGYLFPKLAEKVSPPSASVITGVIWGLWHAPIIAMGYNYGTAHPIAGIFAMVVFCTVLGIITGFLTYKAHSIWPAVLFHASLNGMDLWSPSDLFMSHPSNAFLGPDPTGLLGGIGFIIIAVALLLWNRSPWNRS